MEHGPFLSFCARFGKLLKLADGYVSAIVKHLAGGHSCCPETHGCRSEEEYNQRHIIANESALDELSKVLTKEERFEKAEKLIQEFRKNTVVQLLPLLGSRTKKYVSMFVIVHILTICNWYNHFSSGLIESQGAIFRLPGAYPMQGDGAFRRDWW